MSTENLVTRNQPILNRTPIITETNEVKSEGQSQEQAQEQTQEVTAPVASETQTEVVKDASAEVKEEVKQPDTKSEPEVDWAGKYKEIESSLKDYQSKYEDLKTKWVNPKTYFANDNEFKKQSLLKEHPGLRSSVADKILESDISKMNPVDALTLNALVRNAEILNGESGAKELVLNKYGFDAEAFDYNELSNVDKNKLIEAASQAKEELKKFQDVKVPEIPDYEGDYNKRLQEQSERQSKLKDAWETAVPKLLDANINKLEFDDFNYVIEDEFKEEAKVLAKQFAIENNIEFTQEGVNKVLNAVMAYYKDANIKKIISEARKYEASKVKIETAKELDNPKPINTEVSPNEAPVDPLVQSMGMALDSKFDFVPGVTRNKKRF